MKDLIVSQVQRENILNNSYVEWKNNIFPFITSTIVE